MPDACFCEAIRDSQIRQPANSLSSLAFVVVAWIVVRRALTDRARRLNSASRFTSRIAFPMVFAAALLFVGIGSAIFHATLSFSGQFLDVLGMYLIASFAVIYGYDRLRSLSARTMVTSYVVMNIVLAALLYWIPVARRILFALLVSIAIGIETAIRRRTAKHADDRHIVRAIALVAIAFAIWLVDYTRIACMPESVFQGHAVWHVLGALASWELYLHYRNDSQLESAEMRAA